MSFWRALSAERLRQNHALEHATIAILEQHDPRVRVIARSSSRGFKLWGTAGEAQVRRAVDEALRRLGSGEYSLAVAPKCGTTVAVGVLVGTLGIWLNEFVRSPRQKLMLAAATSVAIAVSAQPVGLLAQRHITTKPGLGSLRVREIRGRRMRGKNWLEVLTAA
ncbi:MAG TPA: DUF6391 domain-containing protein [Chloroflexota bacterium]|nr:DUF6391 domain-containing protein [Chloroflexota bacterium]